MTWEESDAAECEWIFFSYLIHCLEQLKGVTVRVCVCVCVCVCLCVCVCEREREKACVRGGALWKFVRRNYQCSTARQLWGQKEDRLASEYK